GRAGIEAGLPAQPPDLRRHAKGRLRQCRSGDRPGGVVRPARLHPPGGGCGAGCQRTATAGTGLRRGRRTPAALRRALPQRGTYPAGAGPMTALPPPSKVKLGLVIDLDTCVGCHACAVSCKEWNSGGIAGPLTDTDPYGKEPEGVWFNRVHSYEVAETPAQPAMTLHFP